MKICVSKVVSVNDAQDFNVEHRLPVQFNDLILGSQSIFFDAVEVVGFQSGIGAKLHAYEFMLADGTSRWIGKNEEISRMGPHGMGTITSSWDGKTYGLSVHIGGLVILHLNEHKNGTLL